ncbi:glycosyltransferase family A protein [Microbacterium sp. 179-B 1A2 NHS]|uniref:glycosyltransferase family A protein n=1 Tax=Microbacterium sp. 179-B 1A2 NHS TaxID=3142383 RepID=UPI00399FCD10
MAHDADVRVAETVSVVIPVKDDAAALRRCLRALALQSRRPDEIVVVDNDSTDESAAVAAAAGARVVECATPGIPAAAATGYDAAAGSLVLRLDADCVPARSWVEAMTAAASQRPDASVFAGAARFADGPRRLRRPLAAVYLGAYAAVLIPTLGHLPVFGSNMGFRRAAWEAIRAEAHTRDAELHDDLDLAYHFGERHRIVFVPHAAMGISMRPFGDRRAFRRRVRRGAHTVISHWPADFPPVRWMRLRMRRVLHARGVPTRRRAAS